VISIVTATYNSEQYIETCLASVNSQTDVHFEHIVVDGLSTDATLSKLQSGSYPNLKIITEQDSGIYSALNKGIRTASGEIIGFVHSDDKLASNLTLKTIQNAFKEQKCDVLYADLDFFERGDFSTKVRSWRSGEFRRSKLRNGWMPPHPTVFVRKKIYERYGLYDETFKIAADYDFLLRILNDPSVRVFYLQEVTYHMSSGGASNNKLRNLKLKLMEDIRAVKNNNLLTKRIVVMKRLRKMAQFLR